MNKDTKQFLIAISIIIALMFGAIKLTRYSYLSDKDYIKTITVDNTDYSFYLDKKNYLLVYEDETFDFKLHKFALVNDCETLKFRINKITSEIESENKKRKKLLECLK